MTVSRHDISDADFVDSPELASDGTSAYASFTVVSTTSGTKVVVLALNGDGQGIRDQTEVPVEAGDSVVLTGTSGGLGNGTFTVASVTDNLTLVVTESIGTSTEGSASFRYPAGSTKVGIRATSAPGVSPKTVQAFVDGHAALQELVHMADGVGGPFASSLTGAYRETLPAADPFPTSIIWWTDATKVRKIVQKILTLNSSKLPTVIQWSVFAADGTTVVGQVTDAISYSAVFETSRTRTIT